MSSSIYFNKVKREGVEAFIKHHSNSQAKYLLYGDAWSRYMEPVASPPGLEANATAALNGVELLGTTEELSAFAARLAKLLEVPVPTLAHVHGNTTHDFELTDEDRSLMYQHSGVDRLLYERFVAEAKALDRSGQDRHQLEVRRPPAGLQVEARDPLLKSPWPAPV